jgi:hypothetical protein
MNTRVLALLCAVLLVGSASAGSCTVQTNEKTNDNSTGNNSYSDLVTWLKNDKTNEKSFPCSRLCAVELKNNLKKDGWKSRLVKVYFDKKNGKNQVRYCVQIITSSGKVYIDSYAPNGGIDKKVTQLKAGKKWLARCVDGACTRNYNRGIVRKVVFTD